jgi:hypothetical protein
VADELHARTPTGFDLIFELATSPQVELLTIATLNHDTLVEQFLGGYKVAFVDGFSKRDGDVRWYQDELYETKDKRVKILKLHGSVNWYSFPVKGISRPAIFAGKDIANISDGEGRQLKPTFRRPTFLSGINKAAAYQRGIYSDMHFRFHQLLREGNLMVMSGYGWGDTAINSRLDTWLDQSRDNRLILLDREPEKLLERSLTLASGFDSWTRNGQLIPVERWLSEVSLRDIGSHLVRSRT